MHNLTRNPPVSGHFEHLPSVILSVSEESSGQQRAPPRSFTNVQDDMLHFSSCIVHCQNSTVTPSDGSKVPLTCSRRFMR